MAKATPRKNKGTIVQFKATSGGSYAAVTRIQKIKLPFPASVVDEITGLDDDVLVEANAIDDWGNVEIEKIFDPEDTLDAAMLTACGSSTDCFIKATLPSGRTMEFSGNAKEIADSDRTAKTYSRITWKMHCNVIPTFVAPV